MCTPTVMFHDIPERVMAKSINRKKDNLRIKVAVGIQKKKRNGSFYFDGNRLIQNASIPGERWTPVQSPSPVPRISKDFIDM